MLWYMAYSKCKISILNNFKTYIYALSKYYKNSKLFPIFSINKSFYLNNFHFTIVTLFCLQSLILQLKGNNLSNFMPIDLHIISEEVIGVDADGNVISCRLLVLLNRCWKTLLKMRYRNANSFTNCLSKLFIFCFNNYCMVVQYRLHVKITIIKENKKNIAV